MANVSKQPYQRSIYGYAFGNLPVDCAVIPTRTDNGRHCRYWRKTKPPRKKKKDDQIACSRNINTFYVQWIYITYMAVTFFCCAGTQTYTYTICGGPWDAFILLVVYSSQVRTYARLFTSTTLSRECTFANSTTGLCLHSVRVVRCGSFTRTKIQWHILGNCRTERQSQLQPLARWPHLFLCR